MNELIWDVAMALVQKNYPTILKRSVEAVPRIDGTVTMYDLVHDTILKLLKDPHVLEVQSDEEFVEYFLHRQKTVIFKLVHDKKLRLKTDANYHKTQKEASDG